MKGFALILTATLLAGCAARMTSGFNNVSVGMTKAQVIQAAGRPTSVAANGGAEYLNYRLASSFLDSDGSDTSDYYVRLIGGRVESYGHKGDFGTTVLPQTRHQLEIVHR